MRPSAGNPRPIIVHRHVPARSDWLRRVGRSQHGRKHLGGFLLFRLLFLASNHSILVLITFNFFFGTTVLILSLGTCQSRFHRLYRCRHSWHHLDFSPAEFTTTLPTSSILQMLHWAFSWFQCNGTYHEASSNPKSGLVYLAQCLAQFVDWLFHEVNTGHRPKCLVVVSGITIPSIYITSVWSVSGAGCPVFSFSPFLVRLSCTSIDNDFNDFTSHRQSPFSCLRNLSVNLDRKLAWHRLIQTVQNNGLMSLRNQSSSGCYERIMCYYLYSVLLCPCQGNA